MDDDYPLFIDEDKQDDLVEDQSSSHDFDHLKITTPHLLQNQSLHGEKLDESSSSQKESEDFSKNEENYGEFDDRGYVLSFSDHQSLPQISSEGVEVNKMPDKMVRCFLIESVLICRCY